MSKEDAKRKLASDAEQGPAPKMLKVSSDTGDVNKVPAACPATTPAQTQVAQKERKKPGRKPNPASPAVRKAQNRAAQRAFRERKERYLRELETTNKILNEQLVVSQYKNIHLTSQINLYKQLAMTIEQRLVSFVGISEMAAIKEDVLARALTYTGTLFELGNSQSAGMIAPITAITHADEMPQTQLLPSPGSSPPASSAMLSPTSELDLFPQEPLEPPPLEHSDLFCGDVIPTTTTTTTPELLIGRQEMRDCFQFLRLQEFVKAADLFAVSPKNRDGLTQQHEYFLKQPHDPRIDLIPCLPLRARMIEHTEKYDLFELIELLITRAKCHGDTHDPACWEMPEEFFEKYTFLTFSYCKRKSSLYRHATDVGEISRMLVAGYGLDAIQQIISLG